MFVKKEGPSVEVSNQGAVYVYGAETPSKHPFHKTIRSLQIVYTLDFRG
jgi:hypothetical protein